MRSCWIRLRFKSNKRYPYKRIKGCRHREVTWRQKQGFSSHSPQMHGAGSHLGAGRDQGRLYPGAAWRKWSPGVIYFGILDPIALRTRFPSCEPPKLRWSTIEIPRRGDFPENPRQWVQLPCNTWDGPSDILDRPLRLCIPFLQLSILHPSSLNPLLLIFFCIFFLSNARKSIFIVPFQHP